MRRQSCMAIGLAFLMASALHASEPRSDTPLPDADARTLYTLGQLISRTLESFALSPDELKYVGMGLEDGVLQREPKVDLAAEAPRLHELQSARRAATAAAEKDRALEHVANVSANPESIRHANGLIVEPLKSGAGDMPSSTDHVSVHYVGRLVDGTVFDSSLARGEPATFPVKGVIACWNQALPTLRVGTRARLTCPPELAYGDRGLPPAIRPGATLIFELELLGIIR
jgi:FKBP-type peptidyl-prolyl cis-trans isomerase FkpA